MRKPLTTTIGEFVATVTPQRTGGQRFYRLTIDHGARTFFAGTFGTPPSRDVIEVAVARVQHHLTLTTYLARVEPHLDQEAGFR